MDEYQLYRNRDVDLNGDNLFELVRKRENGGKSRHVHFADDVDDRNEYQKHRNVKHSKENNKESSVKKIIWTVVLLIIAGVLLYLTIVRLGVAGKSLYKGNTLTGLALLSPEIGSVVRMGLGF